MSSTQTNLQKALEDSSAYSATAAFGALLALSLAAWGKASEVGGKGPKAAYALAGIFFIYGAAVLAYVSVDLMKAKKDDDEAAPAMRLRGQVRI
jgi:hypothetical protein